MTTTPEPLPFTWRFAGVLFAFAIVIAAAYERVRYARWPDAEFVLLFAAGWFLGLLALRWWWRSRRSRG